MLHEKSLQLAAVPFLLPTPTARLSAVYPSLLVAVKSAPCSKWKAKVRNYVSHAEPLYLSLESDLTASNFHDFEQFIQNKFEFLNIK